MPRAVILAFASFEVKRAMLGHHQHLNNSKPIWKSRRKIISKAVFCLQNKSTRVAASCNSNDQQNHGMQPNGAMIFMLSNGLPIWQSTSFEHTWHQQRGQLWEYSCRQRVWTCTQQLWPLQPQLTRLVLPMSLTSRTCFVIIISKNLS